MTESELDKDLIKRMREDKHTEIREAMVEMYQMLRGLGMDELNAARTAVVTCHGVLSLQHELEFLNANEDRLSKSDQN